MLIRNKLYEHQLPITGLCHSKAVKGQNGMRIPPHVHCVKQMVFAL